MKHLILVLALALVPAIHADEIGQPPVSLPTTAAGVDPSGNVRHLTLDASNALRITGNVSLTGNSSVGGGGISGNNTSSPVSVVGFIARPSASFTRPADTTAYAVGDLVANSTSAGSVAPMTFTAARIAAGTGQIRRVQIRKSGAGVVAAQFRVHFYTASPTPTNGDNGAWLTTGSAAYLGGVDVVVDRAFSDGAVGIGVPMSGSEINFALASGQSIFALLEARAAYTPVSVEQFAVTLEVLQN